ncbi:hypothetical protein BDV96DRAFT_652783 [Lophiotrema nucula]|uniref:ER-bound oxygenase mpaB/mpaB'/Rubber oxygenase catalytic domain-containing protein n=1 Tax=Lophiotrema nucula TaxID=690887 RepID=A0A6A5YN91_9PLEO|nr:hypothetical protein BDV96DRAFT_652783 [Lophiotrema nucula]
MPFSETSGWDLVAKIGPTATAGLGIVPVYVLLCRALRYRRRDQAYTRYPYKMRDDFAKMTTQHAHEILKYVFQLEFPFLVKKSLEFALFRTYGIPTISKLLCETKQLSDLQYAPRRYADTGVLITEFLGQPPSSLRANSAIARMNFLHGMYQRSGKISNDDMLYTLSLFVLEVEKWVRLHEWRSLTDMEIAAMGTLWQDIGTSMSISFSDLPHSPNFRDGYEFVEDLRTWATTYEEKMMVPNDWNHKLAEETIAILLCNVPEFMKPFGKQVVVTLMDERLRKAMIYDKPSSGYYVLVNTILQTRKFFLCYLTPPRPNFMPVARHSDADPKTGRYYLNEYMSEPWYVKPTFLQQYGLAAWFRWALGKPYPDGKKYKPEGFSHFEVGPEKFEKHGLKEFEATRDRLISERVGCPFAVSKA